MAIKAASLFVEIGADTKGADTGMKRVDKGIRALGEVGAGAMKVFGGAILGAGAGLLALGSQALDAYGDFERLGLSLQQMAAKELLNTGQAGDMTQALDMASGKAQELQSWIQKLAIQSPFSQSGVADAFRMAMAYGFNVEQSQRLTKALIDFASGSGASEYAMSKIALALGQIRAKGKLAGGEVLQLTEAGLNVNEILAKAFGKTTAEVVALREQGLIPADQAIEAITSSLESDFAGAAARQASSISGLKNSLEDLKEVGLREFFTATFQEAQPYLNEFVDKLQDPEVIARIREMGTEFAQTGKEIITTTAGVIDWFSRLDDKTKVAAAGAVFLAFNIGNVVKVVGAFTSIAVGFPAIIGGISDAFLSWRLGMSLSEAGLASLGVTIGVVAAAVVAATAVWVTWNEQITKTNRQGAEGVAGAFGQMMTDIKAQGGDAADVVEAFGDRYAVAMSKIDQGGFAGLFVDRTQIARNSLKELSDQLSVMDISYEEYSQMMMKAAQTTGILSSHQARQILQSGNQARINQWLAQNIGLMTDAEYEAARATQHASEVNKLGALSAHEMEMAARGIASGFAASGAAADDFSSQLDNLNQARLGVQTALDEFGTTYADKVANGLKAAGVEGESLGAALGLLDQRFGTNLQATNDAEVAMQAMIDKYKETNDIKAFDSALQDNQSQWEKIDSAIQNALASWRELIGAIGSVNGQHIAMYVDVISNYVAAGSAGAGVSASNRGRFGGEANEDTPGRALGGPAEKDTIYRWQENGDELFIPKTDGYVMNGASTAKLMSLLERFVEIGAGQGGSGKGTIIYVNGAGDPRKTAQEIQRIQR